MIRVALCLVLLAVVTAVSARELLQAAVIHRHGARTEPIVSDTTLNWDFCVLSQEGTKMAKDLGKFLRHRYVDTGFVPAKYDYQTVVSRSTDFERTIRTGVGLIRGMFDFDTYAIPWLDHKTRDTDYAMGFYYSWPSAVLRTPYLESFNVINNNRTLEVLTQQELNLGGELLGYPKICKTEPTTCALVTEDVSTCRLSNGVLAPQLVELLPKFKIIQEESNAFLYNYNASDEYWSHTGPYGKVLADDIIRDFTTRLSAAANKKAGKPLTDAEEEAMGIKLHHFSGHDITVYGYFIAVGAIRPTVTTALNTLVPTFAALITMDLFDDGNVTFGYWLTPQVHGSNHTDYQKQNATMGCKTADGGEYFTTECPIGDFARYVDSKAPLDADAPFCYADPDDVRRTRCGTDDPSAAVRYEVPAPDLHGGSVSVEAYHPGDNYCATYRSLCPKQACSEPFFYNASSGACVRFVYSEEQKKAAKPDYSSGHFIAQSIGLVAASLFGGIAIGVIIRSCFYERMAKKAEAETVSLLIGEAE